MAQDEASERARIQGKRWELCHARKHSKSAFDEFSRWGEVEFAFRWRDPFFGPSVLTPRPDMAYLVSMPSRTFICVAVESGERARQMGDGPPHSISVVALTAARADSPSQPRHFRSTPTRATPILGLAVT